MDGRMYTVPENQMVHITWWRGLLQDEIELIVEVIFIGDIDYVTIKHYRGRSTNKTKPKMWIVLKFPLVNRTSSLLAYTVYWPVWPADHDDGGAVAGIAMEGVMAVIASWCGQLPYVVAGREDEVCHWSGHAGQIIGGLIPCGAYAQVLQVLMT